MQELNLNGYFWPIIKFSSYYFPKAIIFTTYKPGITNLRSIHIDFGSDIQYQEAVEFLNMLPKFCSGIVKLNLRISKSMKMNFQPFLDIIKSQPLEKIRDGNGHGHDRS